MMLWLSALMLGSMHAIRLTHLRHHQHCLDDEDIEGHAARHQFPSVPTRHLARLAMRLDRVAPGLDRKRVM